VARRFVAGLRLRGAFVRLPTPSTSTEPAGFNRILPVKSFSRIVFPAFFRRVVFRAALRLVAI